MGTFDDILASDAELMVDADGFGEQVTYVKRDGTERTINAVVFRYVPEEPVETVEALAPRIEALVRNDATHGITSSELDTGSDTLKLAERIGEAAQEFSILEVLHQDSAAMKLRLR